MTDIWLVYSMFPGREEALSAGRFLIEEKLAACVHVHEKGTSIYRWEGAVQQESETMLMAKMHRAALPRAIARIKALHPYQLPCIVAWPMADGYAPFLQWVAENSGG